ncbi:MAG: vitamin K epoxide reductase family protein [Patescibacteria group bacterium]|nr:vitamin K epoxide reductase family protein [Patescibacteria group bacterium]
MIHKKHKHDIIVLLALVGFADSIYLAVTKALGYSVPCDLTHGCEAVLASRYSTLLGLPLADWGILFFAGVIVAALLANHYRLWRKLLTIALALGSLMALVFLSLQFFVIRQVCQYCLLSDLLAILLLILDLNIEHQGQ